MTKEKWQGHIAIFMVNIMFGLNTPIAKSLMPEWISPMGLTSLRMAFGAFAFWIASIFFVNEKVAKKDMLILFIGALLGTIVNQYLFIVGLNKTSPIDASMILTLNPVIVMIISAIILKEPISLKKTGGVVIGGIGALLIILNSKYISADGTSSSLTGNLQILLSTASYATYLVITRPISQRYSAVTLMKWMFLFATFIALPLGFNDITEAKVFSDAYSIPPLMRLAFVLIGATFIAYFLIPMALKRIRPTTVSTYNYLQPLITCLVAITMGQDTLTWDKPVAALLIFSGVYLVTLSKSREDVEKKAMADSIAKK